MKKFGLYLALALLSTPGLFAMAAKTLVDADVPALKLALQTTDLSTDVAILAVLDQYTPRSQDRVEALIAEEGARKKAAAGAERAARLARLAAANQVAPAAAGKDDVKPGEVDPKKWVKDASKLNTLGKTYVTDLAKVEAAKAKTRDEIAADLKAKAEKEKADAEKKAADLATDKAFEEQSAKQKEADLKNRKASKEAALKQWQDAFAKENADIKENELDINTIASLAKIEEVKATVEATGKKAIEDLKEAQKLELENLKKLKEKLEKEGKAQAEKNALDLADVNEMLAIRPAQHAKELEHKQNWWDSIWKLLLARKAAIEAEEKAKGSTGSLGGLFGGKTK